MKRKKQDQKREASINEKTWICNPYSPIEPEAPIKKKNRKIQYQENIEFFKKHKKLFKEIVDDRRFKISTLYWEEGKTYK